MCDARSMWHWHKMVNGSVIAIGGEASKVTIRVHQHFNWFQKKMLRWCFGFHVEDYSDEEV